MSLSVRAALETVVIYLVINTVSLLINTSNSACTEEKQSL